MSLPEETEKITKKSYLRVEVFHVGTFKRLYLAHCGPDNTFFECFFSRHKVQSVYLPDFGYSMAECREG
jgi:hypothetical protein